MWDWRVNLCFFGVGYDVCFCPVMIPTNLESVGLKNINNEKSITVCMYVPCALWYITKKENP